MAGINTTADYLVPILDLIRFGTANTRPELSRVTGLGRTVVAQRVSALLDAGLVCEGTPSGSTGGRPSRSLEFNANAGVLLVAELGATAVNAALTNLGGDILEQHRDDIDVADGPDVVLGTVERIFDMLLARRPETRVWGIGIGLPGPVEFRIGTPTSPPIMPGWDRYPVRIRMSQYFDAPTWIDNDVNMLALGELRRGLAMKTHDAIFVKIGTASARASSPMATCIAALKGQQATSGMCRSPTTPIRSAAAAKSDASRRSPGGRRSRSREPRRQPTAKARSWPSSSPKATRSRPET